MRICSLLPSATEIAFALGLSDRLVGVTHECNRPGPRIVDGLEILAEILHPALFPQRWHGIGWRAA